jgi:two-component system, sensor histidine kinase and response regulator
VAEAGHAALDALACERFDLVLMDLQMPDMDGLEAVRAIRDLEARASSGDWEPARASSYAGGRIPVVAVTAHAMQGDRERGLAARMDDYITKPIQPAALVAAIERLLPRDALPVATTATAPTVATPSVPSLPVDIEAARRLAGGDEELRAEMAARFVQSCGQHRPDAPANRRKSFFRPRAWRIGK